MNPQWTARIGTDLGNLPGFLFNGDQRPAVEQIHERYAFGGGWQDFEGFSLVKKSTDPIDWRLAYPGDPDMRAVGYCRLRDEVVVLFECSWVAVVEGDEFRVARLD